MPEWVCLNCKFWIRACRKIWGEGEKTSPCTRVKLVRDSVFEENHQSALERGDKRVPASDSVPSRHPGVRPYQLLTAVRRSRGGTPFREPSPSSPVEQRDGVVIRSGGRT